MWDGDLEQLSKLHEGSWKTFDARHSYHPCLGSIDK